MKFSVGYQYPDQEGECEHFPEILSDYASSVEEVYFSPGNEPSGRSPAAAGSCYSEKEALEILLADLIQLREMGIKLNLLFNGSCLGPQCIGKALKERVLRITSQIREKVSLHTVTTCSPFIARILKQSFSDLEIRASVNMKIGTLEAMEYMEDLFDGFCIQREINYHLDTLEKMAQWAKTHNKKLSLLANSGCLRNCAVQTFHDNMVAHFGELKREECCMDSDPIFCRNFYGEKAHHEEYLIHSTLIRPEDVFHYEKITPLMKLATRTHSNPRLVLEAYCSGRFSGNLFDLTEPGLGIFFRGKILDNSRITEEYFKVKSQCREDCQSCSFCREVYHKALLNCTELF